MDQVAIERRMVLAGAGLAGAALAARAAHSGPLTPPAGPVAPTMKPLDVVEPRTPVGPDTTPGDATALFKITQPGSYYLTSNITGETGKHGVFIDSDDVTIDLNGFSLIGVPGAGTGVAARPTSPTPRALAIKNGVVRDWTVGIDFFQVTGGRIEHIVAHGNGASGFRFGNSCIVHDCAAIANGDDGFIFNTHNSIIACVAQANTVNGFTGLEGNALEACMSVFNGPHPNADGFQIHGSTLRACVAEGNSGRGFFLSNDSPNQPRVGGCIAIDCISRANTNFGIEASEHCVLHYCIVTNHANNDGIVLRTGGRAEGCTAINNAGGGGIDAGFAVAIVNCVCRANGGDGIKAFDGSVIRGCSSTNNVGAGITATNALVHSNSVGGNGAGGNLNLTLSTSVDNHVF